MDKLCGNCRHWGKPDEAGLEFRQCRAVVHDEKNLTGDEQWRWADEKEREREFRPFRSEHKAVVQDASGCFAALRTRDDFGCVLWGPK